MLGRKTTTVFTRNIKTPKLLTLIGYSKKTNIQFYYWLTFLKVLDQWQSEWSQTGRLVLQKYVFSSPGRSPGRAIALSTGVGVGVYIYVKVFFKSQYFPNHLIDLIHIWYDDRYSSKVLFKYTPAHYLKFLDLEIFNFFFFFFFFWFGFYGPFKNISLISSRSFIEGGRKPENPEKNHLTIRKQNLAFPHMTRARLEPQRWET